MGFRDEVAFTYEDVDGDILEVAIADDASGITVGYAIIALEDIDQFCAKLQEIARKAKERA